MWTATTSQRWPKSTGSSSSSSPTRSTFGLRRRAKLERTTTPQSQTAKLTKVSIGQILKRQHWAETIFRVFSWCDSFRVLRFLEIPTRSLCRKRKKDTKSQLISIAVMDHWSRWNNESSNLQLVLYFRSLRVHAPLHFSNDRTPALSLESSYKEIVRFSSIGCFVPDPLLTFITQLRVYWSILMYRQGLT